MKRDTEEKERAMISVDTIIIFEHCKFTMDKDAKVQSIIENTAWIKAKYKEEMIYHKSHFNISSS